MWHFLFMEKNIALECNIATNLQDGPGSRTRQEIQFPARLSFHLRTGDVFRTIAIQISSNLFQFLNRVKK